MREVLQFVFVCSLVFARATTGTWWDSSVKTTTSALAGSESTSCPFKRLVEETICDGKKGCASVAKAVMNFQSNLRSAQQQQQAQPASTTTMKKKQQQQQQQNTALVASNVIKVKGGANTKKKVLILMSDTGGGHRASAQAIDRSLAEQFPGLVEVDIMDIWTDHANWPFNRFVPTYRVLAKNPILWRGFYAYGQFPPTKFFTEMWSWQNSYQSFKKAIIKSKPDLVVSVHPLCQLMPIWAVEEMNKARSKDLLPIPFVTIVTDLGGAHSTWFDRRADALFVPSNAVKKLALRNGIKPDKIIMRGLPIRPAFWKASKPKNVLRKTLGLVQKAKTVLLMGGGDGVGGLGNIAVELSKTLSKSPQKSQVIVICGSNKQLSSQLSKRTYPDNVNVVVKNFVNNVDEFMAASDCLVTKAGPGTIAEAMTRGLPLVISSFLPGQEAGNVPYVVDGGFGVYTGNRPRKIADTVFKFFSDDKLIADMSQKAKERSRPGATSAIARDIASIVLRETREMPSLPRSEKSEKI